MDLFTPDLHLFHKNIIRFCNRPFVDIAHMHMALISRWNTVVGEEDNVFVLGDVTFGPQQATRELLDQLHGKKYLIRGNHDHKLRPVVLKAFEWVKDYAEISHNSRKIVLSHYAMRVWNNSHWGSWQLHGHSHGSLVDIGGLQLDVGVDCHNYAPISVTEVERIMASRTKRQEDHHSGQEENTS